MLKSQIDKIFQRYICFYNLNGCLKYSKIRLNGLYFSFLYLCLDTNIVNKLTIRDIIDMWWSESVFSIPALARSFLVGVVWLWTSCVHIVDCHSNIGARGPNIQSWSLTIISLVVRANGSISGSRGSEAKNERKQNQYIAPRHLLTKMNEYFDTVQVMQHLHILIIARV